MLIALGAFIPAMTDCLNRFGSTEFFQLGKLLGVLSPVHGFLVSIEVFREIRVPFTGIRLANRRRESPSIPSDAGEALPGRPVAAATDASPKASAQR